MNPLCQFAKRAGEPRGRVCACQVAYAVGLPILAPLFLVCVMGYSDQIGPAGLFYGGVCGAIGGAAIYRTYPKRGAAGCELCGHGAAPAYLSLFTFLAFIQSVGAPRANDRAVESERTCPPGGLQTPDGQTPDSAHLPLFTCLAFAHCVGAPCMTSLCVPLTT